MNQKKSGILILWISLFIFFTFLVFYIIGNNTDYLVKNIFKNISLILIILSVIDFIIGLIFIINNRNYKSFGKVKMWIISILVALYMIGCSTFLYILYGSFNGFRDWLITTAMATMRHQYYCKWFYNDEQINEVLDNNFIDDKGMETDPSLINHEKVTDYKDEYEKDILDRKDNELYKVINFEVNGCKAYLGVVYDASKIKVGYSKWLGRSGQYVYDMAKEQGSVLTINGGGFLDPGHNTKGENPVGITIANGKIITNRSLEGSSYGLIGFNEDNTLVLLHNVTGESALERGVRDAVTMAPFLLVNGKPAFAKGNGGWGYAARTAIGQRKDGIVLFLVIDSNHTRTKGASMKDLVEIMQRYGAVNAANLDGGTSSAMVENGIMINDPIDSVGRHRTRGIPTVFNVIP